MVAQSVCWMAFVPSFRVEIQRLDLSVLEEARQADSVICQMRFFADDDNVVFSPLSIKLQKLLSVELQSVNRGLLPIL